MWCDQTWDFKQFSLSGIAGSVQGMSAQNGATVHRQRHGRADRLEWQTQKSSALIEAQEQTKPTAGSRSTRSAAPKFKRNEKIQTKKIARNNEPRTQLRRPPSADHCELLASDANHEKWRHRTTQKVGVTSWPLGGAPIAASGATVPPHKNFEKSNGRVPDDVGMFVLLHLLEQGNFA